MLQWKRRWKRSEDLLTDLSKSLAWVYFQAMPKRAVERGNSAIAPHGDGLVATTSAGRFYTGYRRSYSFGARGQCAPSSWTRFEKLVGGKRDGKALQGGCFAGRGATSFVFSGTDCALLDAKYDVTGSGRGIPRGWHRRGYGISYKLCRMRAGGDGACEGGKSPTGGGPRLSILLVRQPVTGNGELFRPIIQGHRGGG